MFCYKCGAELPDGVVFCHKCGAKMPVENVSEEITDALFTVQNNQDNVLQQKDTIIQEQNFESSSAINDGKNDFKDSADDYISVNQKAANICVESDRTWENSDNSQYGQATYMKHSQVGYDNAEQIFGDNIKPYYREQFERIASGQKPGFNWAAFFLNGWIQLYNGCTGIFCKTFLPLLIALYLTSLIGLLGMVRFDFILLSISSGLGIIVGFCSLILCIVNGFRFNKWYYQDVINNPGKRRSRKGFWILIAVQTIMIVLSLLLPALIFTSSADPIDDLSVELTGEDPALAQSEDIIVSEEFGSEKSVTNDEAEEMVSQWLISHPIYPGFQSDMSPSLDKEAFDNEGNDSWAFDLWVDGEEYAEILVNKDDGDIIIEYLIWNESDRTYSRDQMPIDQWYSDIYLTETADRMNDDGYEGAAREIIMEWFSRRPLMHDIRIQFMNETVEAEDGSGTYLKYEMYWGDDEWYGTFYVNPDTGDMVMDSMIMATGPTIVQESMDQWYLEDYWFLGEDLGGYSELYENNIYVLYNEAGNPILEYHSEYDSYAICDYDGQCLIEYDDGSATSEIGIMNFAGTFGYDGSFEAEGTFVNFYYLLEIGEWDGYCFSINEIWRGNPILQDEWARPKSLIVDTLIFDISSPDGAGYETHYLTYIPAKDSPLGEDTIYIDGDETMPFVRE